MQDTGSFRDRTSRVFYCAGDVCRVMSEQALNDYRKIAVLPFFKEGQERGLIVKSEEVPIDGSRMPQEFGAWAGMLRHERVPFISYPYEWCFGMLKAAAELQLDINLSALENDFISKDSSAYNIQFKGVAPIFIDIGSFEALQAGEPWVGYRQFCQMFLYPLMLLAYKQVPFHVWMKGSLDGFEVSDMNGLMTLRDLFRPGVFKHVFLHSKLEKQHAGSTGNVRSELKELGFGKELIKANLNGLKAVLKRLSLKPVKSIWVDYASDNSYSAMDARTKQEFIGEVSSLRTRELVWDLGCNTGVFSRIVAENSKYVVAMDYDHYAVERLYQELKEEKCRNILPLVMNLAAPSPDHGWRGMERQDLLKRGKPDLILALALIHHMVISANIPLAEFIAWLAGLSSELVIEFVTREDPMVKTLLANKRDIYHDYNQEALEAALRRHYSIVKTKRLASGTRELYYCRQQL